MEHTGEDEEGGGGGWIKEGQFSNDDESKGYEN